MIITQRNKKEAMGEAETVSCNGSVMWPCSDEIDGIVRSFSGTILA